MNLTIDNQNTTIGDIIRIALPLETVVMAGARHTKRNVVWVSILTSHHDLESQIETGDLVMVPPNIHKHLTDIELRQGLHIFAKRSIAGLLLFQTVSEDVVAVASRLNIPVLVTPSDISVRHLHRTIAALLVDQQTATKERGMELYRQLSEMSREGHGLQAMTDLICKLTGKIVAVQDKRLDVQAVSQPPTNQLLLSELEKLLVQREQLPPMLRNRKAAAKARQSHWQQLLLNDENIGRLVSPIISGDRARGYLSVIGYAEELDLLDTLAVEHGAAACALEMAKAKAVSEAKKALRGDFLEGLLAGTLEQKEIARLERRLDHDTTQAHAVMTFRWADSEKSPPSLRGLETTINWLLSNHNRPALVHIYANQHICIFQAMKDATEMETIHELARRIVEQVETEYPKSKLIGGMAGPAEDLQKWPQMYVQALQAMQLSERLKLNYVVEFSSLGVYRLLSALEDIPAVQEFIDQLIGPLARYDEQHRGSLVQTIDAYFAHHGNISKTAESLFVHRNTLLYRLERIQELTGQDLNQADMRLAFHLSLKLWQLRPDM